MPELAVPKTRTNVNEAWHKPLTAPKDRVPREEKSAQGKYQVWLEIWGLDKDIAYYKLNCSQSKQESEKYPRNICCLWMTRVGSRKINHIEYQPYSAFEKTPHTLKRLAKELQCSLKKQNKKKKECPIWLLIYFLKMWKWVWRHMGRHELSLSIMRAFFRTAGFKIWDFI